jgi:hypothetical protein
LDTGKVKEKGLVDHNGAKVKRIVQKEFIIWPQSCRKANRNGYFKESIGYFKSGTSLLSFFFLTIWNLNLEEEKLYSTIAVDFNIAFPVQAKR